jgi:ribonuclease BN (tRNA processing enzyme)
MRELTVLGSSGVWPEAGRACSGFLLAYNGFRVVLDLGFGTLPRLLERCMDGAVDAVVITHEHSDHCVDLAGLARVRYFGDRARRIPLYCTPGVISRVDGLEPHAGLDEVFQPYELPGSYDVGPFRLDAVPLPHLVPNAGIRLSTSDFTMAYTGDSMPDPALLALGKDADLFIVNATRHEPPVPGEPRGMLTAGEAGEWAQRAGAARLLLSHFWPGADRAISVARAHESFTGQIVTAEEGLVIPLDRLGRR